MTDGEFRPSPARVLYALRQAHLAVEARKERMLRVLGLRPAHYAVLINVWAHPGVTGAELARHLGVTPQNVASLVAKLAARGLLERSPHARHGHVLELRLTAAGQSLLERADQEVAALEEQVRAMMTQDRAAALLDTLNLVVAGLPGAGPAETQPEGQSVAG